MHITHPVATVSAIDGSHIDRSWLIQITQFADHNRWLDHPMMWFTNAGLAIFAVLMLVGWWQARRRDQRTVALALLAPIAVVVTFGVAEIVKKIVAEPRPCRAVPHAFILESCPAPSDYSFPSGHATVAAATVGALILVSRKLAVIAAACALLEGFSRVFVGGHYPHDVIASYVLAAPIAYLVSRSLAGPATALVARLAFGRWAPLVAAAPEPGDGARPEAGDRSRV